MGERIIPRFAYSNLVGEREYSSHDFAEVLQEARNRGYYGEILSQSKGGDGCAGRVVFSKND